MHPIRRVALLRLLPIALVATSFLTQIAIPESSAQSDLTFEPYSVYVAKEESHARCGPAADYYRTDPLRQGQELEVYAETDDGWLGIRPPKDSFCWVPADTIEMNGDKEDGTVTEDRTVAWIGTHLGRAKTYRWQVQLAKGEPVTVIGRSEREGPDGPQMWFRIVPPSGEYRWVHRDEIVNSSEELVALMRQQTSRPDVQVFPRDQPKRNLNGTRTASNTPREPSPSMAQSKQSKQSKRRSQTDRDSIAESGRSILKQDEMVGSGLNEEWKAGEDRSRSTEQVAAASIGILSRPRLLEIAESPSAPSASEKPEDANWVAGNSRTQPTNQSFATPSALTANNSNRPNPNRPNPSPVGSIQQASAQQPIASTRLLSPQVPTAKQLTFVSSERIAQVESESQNADVERLGLIFSRLMAARATALEAEPVARAARRLASSSPDVVIAGRARLLAERIEQYRRVADRRDGETMIRSDHSPVIPASLTVPRPNGNAGPLYNGSPANATLPPTSNETGYLVQVYSARANSPPFALTDNRGRTIAYVTPSPGVNLRTHLNSRVSVFGNQGYLTGLNTPHILATQAVRTPE